MTIITSGGGDTMMFTTRIGGGRRRTTRSSRRSRSAVDGEDLANLVVTTSKGATATGKVTFEGGAPGRPGDLRVTARRGRRRAVRALGGGRAPPSRQTARSS